MRVFCFDLDDTLVSESDYVESGLRAAGAVADRLLEIPAGSSAEWFVGEWRRTHARDLFQAWFARFGRGTPSQIAALVQAYREHAPRIALREGAMEVMRALHERGHRLALITDGHLESQRLKWASLRVEIPVEPLLFTDERGRNYWKPHPWAYELVMQRWPSADGYVYVGDNVEKDFIAPNRLGWRTVRIWSPENLRPREEGDALARATREIETFGDLLEEA